MSSCFSILLWAYWTMKQKMRVKCSLGQEPLLILPIPAKMPKRDDANVVEYDPGGYSGTVLTTSTGKWNTVTKPRDFKPLAGSMRREKGPYIGAFHHHQKLWGITCLPRVNKENLQSWAYFAAWLEKAEFKKGVNSYQNTSLQTFTAEFRAFCLPLSLIPIS